MTNAVAVAKYRAAHPERVLAGNRARYAANPEKFLAATAKWRAAHPGYGVAWDLAHPGYHAAASAAWQTAHPEKYRAKESKRRAMKLMQRCVCCSDADIQEVFDVAALCGSDAHVDHRTPLALGGHHCIKNLQVLTVEAHKEKTKADVRQIANARQRSRLLAAWRSP